MKRLKTFIAISGLLTFILSVERFYTYAFIYDPLRSDYRPETIHEPQKQKDNRQEKKPLKEPSIKESLVRLFGIHEIKRPEKPLTTIAPPPPPSPPEQPPQMVLKGIILEPGGTYRAYIEIDGKKMLSLRAGEGVDNIIITDIKERRVSLRWKDQTLELSIEPKRH